MTPQQARLLDVINMPMSGEDIKRFLPHTRVLTYPEFATMNSIDEAFGPDGTCVFLYETSHGYGHWCALFKRPKNQVEVFDSYGYVPDDELKLIPKHFRKINNETRPHLAFLLQASPYQIHYNPYRLQSDARDVATCGRHCVARLWHRQLPIEDYAHRLAKLECKGITPDEYVAALFSPL